MRLLSVEDRNGNATMLFRKPLEVVDGVKDISVFNNFEGLASIVNNNAGVGELGQASLAIWGRVCDTRGFPQPALIQ